VPKINYFSDAVGLCEVYTINCESISPMWQAFVQKMFASLLSSVNSTMTGLSIKNKSYINKSSTVDCLVTSPESTKFGKITQNKGHYVVQGNSTIKIR